MAFAVRRIERLGVAYGTAGILLSCSESSISDDVRLLERGTAAAIIPRHLH